MCCSLSLASLCHILRNCSGFIADRLGGGFRKLSIAAEPVTAGLPISYVTIGYARLEETTAINQAP